MHSWARGMLNCLHTYNPPVSGSWVIAVGKVSKAVSARLWKVLKGILALLICIRSLSNQLAMIYVNHWEWPSVNAWLSQPTNMDSTGCLSREWVVLRITSIWLAAVWQPSWWQCGWYTHWLLDDRLAMTSWALTYLLTGNKYWIDTIPTTTSIGYVGLKGDFYHNINFEWEEVWIVKW